MQPTPSLYCSKTSLSPSFSPLSRVLSNNSVTVTTVSKHQFHLVLQCGVNNTECTAHTQSFNRDGGTSNSTAAATFIRKSQDVSLSTPLFRPLLCPHTKHSAHLCLFFFASSVATVGITSAPRTGHADAVWTPRSVTPSHLPVCSCKWRQPLWAIVQRFFQTSESSDLGLSGLMDGRKVHLGLRETQEHWNKMTSNSKIPL